MNTQINLFDEKSEFFEIDTSEINLDKLNFKVHASVIYKLGEALIADEITALSELLKNAYDADASFCKLVIDPFFESQDGKGKICISDNGCGMNLETIVSGWLTISNSPKKKMKKAGETTSRFHRIPLGEKGLGRLSVQKLGRKVKMTTKEAGTAPEYTITIPWDEFLKNTTLDNVNIVCEKNNVDFLTSYTKIEITGLINPEYWTQEATVKNLENSIGRIISPFRFAENSFTIFASVGDYTIDVSNSIFNDVLNTARSNYSFKVDEKKVKIISKYKVDFFRRRRIEKDYPEFDYHRDYFKEIFEKYCKEIDGWKYHESGDITYEIETILNLDSYDSLIRDKNSGNLYYPGAFEGEIFDFYFDKGYVNDILNAHSLGDAFNDAEYRNYIKDNKGIKVIRDGFVVQGYGDGNVDWLNISASSTTTGKFSDINNESTIGYIKLTGAENQKLKETTSREGFVADEYYKNFYMILRNIIIRKINQQNMKLITSYSKYLENLFLTSRDSQSAIEQIQTISEKANSLSSNISSKLIKSKEDIEKTLQRIEDSSNQVTIGETFQDDIKRKYENIINQQTKTLDSLKEELLSYFSEVKNIEKEITRINVEIDNYKEKMADVFALAGLGVSVELFTHELYTTINNVNEKIRSVQNQTTELKYINNAMNSLRKQISYFHPGLKYVRQKKDDVLISNIINAHLSFYHDKCELNGIEQAFISSSRECKICINVGMLNQVLDNLFSNSLYWLSYSRDTLHLIDDCSYTIQDNGDWSIDVWDNGIGISKDIERDLFEPFVTCKHEGRGLGLFICKNNLENNNSSIRLLRDRNQFGNLYRFHIDLSNLKKLERE